MAKVARQAFPDSPEYLIGVSAEAMTFLSFARSYCLTIQAAIPYPLPLYH